MVVEIGVMVEEVEIEEHPKVISEESMGEVGKVEFGVGDRMEVFVAAH